MKAGAEMHTMGTHLPQCYPSTAQGTCHVMLIGKPSQAPRPLAPSR